MKVNELPTHIVVEPDAVKDDPGHGADIKLPTPIKVKLNENIKRRSFERAIVFR